MYIHRYLDTYTHTDTRWVCWVAPNLGLYKIFFDLEAFVHESVIFFASTPFVLAHHPTLSSPPRLRNLLFPSEPPVLQDIAYNIGYGNIV